jgi:hypothetical protein
MEQTIIVLTQEQFLSLSNLRFWNIEKYIVLKNGHNSTFALSAIERSKNECTLKKIPEHIQEHILSSNPFTPIGILLNEINISYT